MLIILLNPNDIMFANIQKAHMDDVSIKAVSKEFVQKNKERMYFSSFTE